jgi:hypothetical protein
MFNFPAFNEAAYFLRCLTFFEEVFDPAERDADKYDFLPISRNMKGTDAELEAHGFPLEEAMAEDLAYIRDEATHVIMLQGWTGSEGAQAEYAAAREAGCWIIHFDILRECDNPTELLTPVDREAPTEPETEDTAELFPAAGTVRGGILDEAKGLITGDRNNSYGPPTQDFDRTAGILNALGYKGPGGRDLQPHDTAIMVMAVKLSRITWTPEKRDHYVDLAGYAACGGECAT